MITGSFSYYRLPGVVAEPKEFLEIVVETVQLVSCTDIITLNAIIITNYPGHTYLWEQISGPPVIWLEPQNQTTVTFQKPSTDEDLVFRFWADRYTRKQQFKDMIVATVARDNVTYSLISKSSGGVDDSLAGASNGQFIPTLSAYGTVVVDNPQKILTWTNPVSGLYYEYTKTEVYLNNYGSLTFLASFPYPISQYSNTGGLHPNTNSVYLLRTYYYIYGQNFRGEVNEYVDVAAPSEPVDSALRTIDASDVVYSALRNETLGDVTIFQTQIVSLINLPETTDDTVYYDLKIENFGDITTFQTQIVTLTGIPEVTDDTVYTAINTINNGDITVFQTQISEGITVIG
jgi:hypothetical protein